MKKRLIISDFTSRLPGPLSTYLLQEFSFQVYKWEDQVKRDPFLNSPVAKEVKEFQRWYKKLNQKKQLMLYDQNRVLNRKEINTLKRSHIILLPRQLGGWLKDLLKIWKSLPGKRGTLLIGGSKDQGALQDLIAQAEAKLITRNGDYFHPPRLPYVPLGGIIFGHQIALECLNLELNLLTGKKRYIQKHLFLEGLLQKNLAFLAGTLDDQNLHQGFCAGYNLYPLKDKGVVVLAAIEASHYQRIFDHFNLPVPTQNRLKKDPIQIKKMRAFFKALTHNQFKRLLRNQKLEGLSLLY